MCDSLRVARAVFSVPKYTAEPRGSLGPPGRIWVCLFFLHGQQHHVGEHSPNEEEDPPPKPRASGFLPPVGHDAEAFALRAVRHHCGTQYDAEKQNEEPSAEGALTKVEEELFHDNPHTIAVSEMDTVA